MQNFEEFTNFCTTLKIFIFKIDDLVLLPSYYLLILENLLINYSDYQFLTIFKFLYPVIGLIKFINAAMYVHKLLATNE